MNVHSVNSKQAGSPVVLLERGFLPPRSVQGIQLLEGTLGPDTEAAQVPPGGQQQEVQAVHFEEVDPGEVAKRTRDPVVFVVDDERALSLNKAPVPHLSLSGTQLPRGLTLLDVGISIQCL